MISKVSVVCLFVCLYGVGYSLCNLIILVDFITAASVVRNCRCSRPKYRS
jgi:hypothetical protein